MLNNLRTRLTLLILGGAISSIILVSIITNITLFNEFGSYMRNEQKNRLQEIIHLVENSYAINNEWDEQAINNIIVSPLLKDFDIEISDINKNLIFSHYMESTTISMHNEMMRRMGHSMRGRNHQHMNNEPLRDEDYAIESFDLISNGTIIGTISIGYIGPFLISERELEFTKGINLSILYGALISILVTILMGLYFSKIFSRPIINITEGANKISKGDLDTKVVGNNINELNDLSNALNHLSVSLKDQELLRKRLTSDISHELRTPLTILQSHIEAISDGVWEATPEKLEICKNEVVRLIKLVDQLGYLTDIEKHQQTLDTQMYSLSNDMREIVDSFDYQFVEKGIHLKSSLKKDISFLGDRDKIKQVIINLLANALKFTDKEGYVDIELSEKKTQIIITVKDTGIGMNEADLPYIFERFYRTDHSRSRKTGGAGIGLAITKSIVEAHGGKIVVSSKEGIGTKFTVILPKSN